jgi:2-amino-4-hydroxy-6-hydroxymethyldihydropteridine diphosphokinase
MNGVTTENWDQAIIVALGSNLDGEYGTSSVVIDRALEEFPDIGLTVKAKSSIWRSKAWPDPTKPDYFNAVAVVEAELTSRDLLGALHELEARFGRRRKTVNESRVLDLDLIAFGRVVCDSANLVLPHPRAAERRFVMGPLAEIAPDWRHPVSDESAIVLAALATVGRDAEPLPASSALHKTLQTPM